MPTKRLRLTRVEEIEYRAMCRQLAELGMEIGTVEEPRSQPVRFTLEPGELELARLRQLPDGHIAAVLPARLTIWKPGVMFTEGMVLLPWDNLALELEGPEEHPYFDRLKWMGPSYDPTVLNHLLVGRPYPLRPCQWDGLIIATGWGNIPAQYQDEARVKLDLRLRDDRGTNFTYDFSAVLDRSLLRMYERRRPAPSVIAGALAERPSLFEKTAELGVAADARRRDIETKAEESVIDDKLSRDDIK